MKIRSAILMSSITLASCVTVEPRTGAAPTIKMTPPAIVQLGDAKHWIVVSPIKYEIVDNRGIAFGAIIVPKGFITDLASVPKLFWNVLSPVDRYLDAAILHDYLYWDQRCEKRQADLMLYVGMKSYGVDVKKRQAVFQAVYKYGVSAFQENQREKLSGEYRFVSSVFVDRFLDRHVTTNDSWHQIRKEANIQNELAEDSSNATIKEICQFVWDNYEIAERDRNVDLITTTLE